MTNASVTLLEKNVQQALEKFEALLSTEGTEALKKQWPKTKKALSVLDAPYESGNLNLGDVVNSGPDTTVPCQGPGCP